MTSHVRQSVLWAGAVLGGWCTAAVALGATGLLTRSPVPPPAIALALTGAILVLLRISRPLREHARNLGSAPLVAFHLIRMPVGAYFLVLYGRGSLPAEFAIAAGWGDIFVGLGALLVLWFCLPADTTGRRRGLLLWNTLGLVDILLVLGNGIRLFPGDPEFAAAFTRLPLALLPTFIVPLVICSHVVLFAWNMGAEPRTSLARA